MEFIPSTPLRAGLSGGKILRLRPRMAPLSRHCEARSAEAISVGTIEIATLRSQ